MRYGEIGDVVREVRFRAELVSKHREFLAGLRPSDCAKIGAGMLINLGVSIKHRGFEEEQEWRLVYMAHFKTPQMEARREVMVLGGVPQVVYRLPITLPCDEDYDEQTRFFERLIIGPCAEAPTVTAGTVALLEKYGFKDAKARVLASEIPYRRRM